MLEVLITYCGQPAHTPDSILSLLYPGIDVVQGQWETVLLRAFCMVRHAIGSWHRCTGSLFSNNTTCFWVLVEPKDLGQGSSIQRTQPG